MIYLQDALDAWIGTDEARVILPITDPYVVHHGALGSFALVYLPRRRDQRMVAERIAALPGIESGADAAEAAAALRAAAGPHRRPGRGVDSSTP